jgi:ABC-type sugar transport system ATPase subunit
MEVIRLQGVTKVFPGVVAVDSADFTLNTGEIHALVGKNGAGKSTLISMICGVQVPDSGEILFDSEPVPYHRLSSLPVATVFQESTLFADLSIADNVFAGDEPVSGPGLVRTRTKHEETRKLLDHFSIKADPGQKVSDLSPAEQKVVEILRAMRRKSRVLILDEPTAALTISESNKLFELLRNVRNTNVGIIYISHRLEEIFQASDRVTVIRDGRIQGTRNVDELSMDELITMMVGRRTELEKIVTVQHSTVRTEETPALEVDAVTDHYFRFRDVSFNAYAGEILGLSGLLGAGKTELATALFGLRRIDHGSIRVGGRPVSIRSPQEAIQHGIVYVTEDRKSEGLFLEMSLAENMSSTILDRVSDRMGFVSGRRMDKFSIDAMGQFDISTTGPEQTVGTLSGGNQQKVLLAMWLQLRPRVLIVDEPTVGIDVSAKVEIYKLLRQIADDGSAVILISSETKEILNNADRILTMFNGTITGEVLPAETDEDSLLRLISGTTEVMN